jgi:hypothetical protein
VADDVAARVVPFQRYYLCIDGTGTEDSVEYGRLLEEKFGWRNLLTEFLEPPPNPAPGDIDRLLDPNHPFLPIPTFPVAGRKKPIAVACPGGRNGEGLDPFWRTYIGETPDEQASQGRHVFIPPDSTARFETFGRQTAAAKSALFMRDLILVPAIEKNTDAQGKPFAQLKDGPLSGVRNPTAPDVHAEFLVVSSHGWLGGFMHGDPLKASRTAEPDKAKASFFVPFVYFLSGLAVANNQFFFGPKWVLLAQCSTVNSATWLMWAKLMARGIPAVRGILGYEEVSPGVTGSIAIARDFFNRLKDRQPLLKAWRGANADQKWAAIVHREAIDDLMPEWDLLPELKDVTLTAKDTSYLAFGASLERGTEKLTTGKPVLDAPPPFGVKVETADASLNRDFQEITEDTLDRIRAKLFADIQVRVTITAPPGAKISAATVRWVHMRETHSTQPKMTALFQSFVPVPAGSLTLTVSTKDARTLNAQPTAGPVDSMVILWTAQPDAVLERSGMEHAHSYVWPLVKIDVVGGKEPLAFPFSAQGLLF